MGPQPRRNPPLTPEQLLQQNMENAALEVEQQFGMGRPRVVAAPVNDAPVDLAEENRLIEVIGKLHGQHNGNDVYIGGLPTGSQDASFYPQKGRDAANAMNRTVRSTVLPFRDAENSRTRAKLGEGVNVRLWSNRAEYEDLLPPQVRQSMAQRRAGGFDVPFRPVPDHVIDFWRRQGPRLTNAQIQWGYAERDKAERNGRLPGQPARQRPMTRQEIAAEFPVDPRNGQPWAPGHEPLGGVENIARRDDELGARARALIQERDQRLAGNAGQNGGAAQEAVAPPERQGVVDEAQAIENNNANRVRGIREGLHPQQDMDLGNADDQNRWNQFVGQSADRMNRFRPGSLVAEVNAPSWREREAEFDAKAAEGEIPPEEIEQKKRGFNMYFAAENNRRAREIALRFGGSMKEETVQALMAASAPVLVNRAASQAEARQQLQEQSDALSAIERTGRFYDRIGRARNLQDQKQNRRFVGIATNPDERAGFAFRTMASGTPEERSAFALATNNPLAYVTEMENSGGGNAAPQAGRQNQNPRPVPADEMLPAQQSAATFDAVDERLRAGDAQAASEMMNTLASRDGMTPEQAEEQLALRMLYVGKPQEDGTPGRDYTRNGVVMRALANYAAQGFEAFYAFVSQAGIDEQQAQVMFQQFTGRSPDRPNPRPQVDSALEDAIERPQTAF